MKSKTELETTRLKVEGHCRHTQSLLAETRGYLFDLEPLKKSLFNQKLTIN